MSKTGFQRNENEQHVLLQLPHVMIRSLEMTEAKTTVKHNVLTRRASIDHVSNKEEKKKHTKNELVASF
jgi:hypothetical protein